VRHAMGLLRPPGVHALSMLSTDRRCPLSSCTADVAPLPPWTRAPLLRQRGHSPLPRGQARRARPAPPPSAAAPTAAAALATLQVAFPPAQAWLLSVSAAVAAGALAVVAWLLVPVALEAIGALRQYRLLAAELRSEVPPTATMMRLAAVEAGDALEEVTNLGADLTAGARRAAAALTAAEKAGRAAPGAARAVGAAARGALGSAARSERGQTVRSEVERRLQESSRLGDTRERLKSAASVMRRVGAAARVARAAPVAVEIARAAATAGERALSRNATDPRYETGAG